ncbi:MAG: glycosyltransferase family 4 protein [Dysgonamonadaceae bacterium]|jgi:glycosyltransferase involved in cell wall biosynthesis|nr:glycosyltransferase family 4 protein [Dysgonamonadaceae bacterium]
MKIIHIVWGLEYGGTETMLVDIVNRQCLEHEVELLIINDKVKQKLIDLVHPKVRIIRINRPPSSKNPWYIVKLNFIILRSGADIIHSQVDDFIRFYHLHFLKKNLCLTVHCVHLGYRRIHRYDCVFAITEEVRDSLKKQTGIESIVVHNGIDTGRFTTKKKIDPEQFQIVQIGRLDHLHKGQHLTLQALHLLVYQYGYTNIRLDIIGEGRSEKYLQELTDKLKIRQYVRFLGSKTKEYIRENLSDYDLLVQPSLWEGFGLTIIEAMSAMTLTLTSNVDGMHTASKNGEMSYTFKSGDTDDFAQKIDDIIRKPSSEKEMLAAKAHHFALENFDISTTVNNYLNYYQDVIRKYSR